MNRNKYKNCQGFSLVEIMIAAILIGVLAVALSSALPHAARQRMNARLREAALTKASSMMERVYAEVDSSKVSAGDHGYFDANMNQQTAPPNPSLQWSFDGIPYDVETTFTNDSNHILEFTVSVFCEGSRTRPVSLYGEKCMK